MGVCSSCLGGRRKRDVEDPATARLLSDDPYRSNYGSRAQNTRRPADEADAEHARRERAALESIAHGMSEAVVDIFIVLPEDSDNVNKDRSGSPPPCINGFKEDDAIAQKTAYRTIKKSHINKISIPMGGGKHDWKDVKAAMG